jgi:hypothetical protein
MVVLASASIASASHAELIFSDGFESGTLEVWSGSTALEWHTIGITGLPSQRPITIFGGPYPTTEYSYNGVANIDLELVPYQRTLISTCVHSSTSNWDPAECTTPGSGATWIVADASHQFSFDGQALPRVVPGSVPQMEFSFFSGGSLIYGNCFSCLEIAWPRWHRYRGAPLNDPTSPPYVVDVGQPNGTWFQELTTLDLTSDFYKLILPTQNGHYILGAYDGYLSNWRVWSYGTWMPGMAPFVNGVRATCDPADAPGQNFVFLEFDVDGVSVTNSTDHCTPYLTGSH